MNWTEPNSTKYMVKDETTNNSTNKHSIEISWAVIGWKHALQSSDIGIDYYH